MAEQTYAGGTRITYLNGIPTSSMKILQAIAVLMEQRKPCTYRSIMEICGYKSPNAVNHALSGLLKAGVVTNEGGKAATIYPRVRFIPADQIAPNRLTVEKS